MEVQVINVQSDFDRGFDAKLRDAYRRNYRLFLALYATYVVTNALVTAAIAVLGIVMAAYGDDVETVRVLSIAVSVGGVVATFVHALGNGFGLQTRKASFHQGVLDLDDVERARLAGRVAATSDEVRKRVGYRPLI